MNAAILENPHLILQFFLFVVLFVAGYSCGNKLAT